MALRRQNTTVLCVDDDESILQTYQNVLTPEQDEKAARIKALLRKGREAESPAAVNRLEFNVLLASSGEQAISTLKQELAAGRRVAAGFFDMRMPGGIDGHTTIAELKALDPNIMCAVVTAHSDRPILEVRKLFPDDHQDELLFFRKPFDPEELEQSAYNMVSAWNRKRREEEHLRIIDKHRQGLGQILQAVSTLSKIPPYSLQQLISGLLFQLIGLVNGEHGYVLLQGRGESAFHTGVGEYEGRDDIVELVRSNPAFRAALADNAIHFEGNKCFLPLACGEKSMGALFVESNHGFEDKVDGEILEVFKTQMVNLVLNSLFYDEILEKDFQVITDPLTNLFNRRFVIKRLREELNRASRFSFSIGVFMVDIDNFKAVNDTYGHDAGDQVLIGVANVLKAAVREYDIIGRNIDAHGPEAKFAIRYGGEEFSLVLLQIDEQGARTVGERIRKTIESVSCPYKGVTIKVTVSIGIAVERINRLRLMAENCMGALFSRADQALYLAKDKGKNRVELFAPEQSAD